MPLKANEELANTCSHGLGIVFGLVMFPVIISEIYRNVFNIHLLSILLYSFCFLFLFTSSTTYHFLKDIKRKERWQIIDHVSIYFMIAGSYTPFIFACLSGNLEWIFFSIMWGIVAIGTVFKIFYTGRFEKLSLILYLSMGWMVLFIIKPFLAHFDRDIISLVIAGGLAYTMGVYFYANDQKKYFHFIWHLFVLAGAILHFFAIRLI